MKNTMQFRKTQARRVLALVMVAGALAQIHSYPEYVDMVRLTSGREINCALCHTNPEGPIGLGIGQLSRLDSAQQLKLAQAHAAMAPNLNVENPLLNEFGNSIIKTMGRQAFLDLRQEALLQKNLLVFAQLAESLDPASDLDDDGISDARELTDGTHVLLKNHGNPVRLFYVNIKRNALLLTALFIGLGLLVFGLGRLLRGFLFSGPH